ncbi:MAG: alpha/beta fold hydrolase, partial [Casimicrobium sp.]
APAPADSTTAYPPIVFVHGNGDTAALWLTTMWRFEVNGWPSNRLHVIDVPYPNSRDDDSKPQAGRSSTAEHAQFLANEVAAVRKATGAAKVILIGNSRGGYAIRNYVQNMGGDAFVSHAILGAVPNHGVWANDKRPKAEGSEFFGNGAFLRQLNAPKNAAGDEVVGPVRWLTLRSDNNDKYAQPDGAWLGIKGTQTGVTFEGPALKGATNIVLPGRDHREVSFHPDAFAATWQYITGNAPKTLAIPAEKVVVLNGKINALGIEGVGDFVTNVPLAGATLDVFAVNADGERMGAAVHHKTTTVDGLWGPFSASPDAAYEFVISAEGYATTHIYRAPFPRSSKVIHMRPARVAAADRTSVAVVTLTRPRGYFGLGRDVMSLDGKPLAGIVAGVAGGSTAKVTLSGDVGRSVVAEFNGDRITARAWPVAGNHVTLIELH